MRYLVIRLKKQQLNLNPFWSSKRFRKFILTFMFDFYGHSTLFVLFYKINKLVQHNRTLKLNLRNLS